MIRNILSVATGLLTSFIIIIILEAFGQILYPPPATINVHDAEAMKEFLSHAPTKVFILILVAYALGSFIGGWISSMIARVNKSGKAMTVGGVLMGVGMYNLMNFQHPLWVVIAGVFAFLPFSFLGGKLGVKMTPPKEQ